MLLLGCCGLQSQFACFNGGHRVVLILCTAVSGIVDILSSVQTQSSIDRRPKPTSSIVRSQFTLSSFLLEYIAEDLLHSPDNLRNYQLIQGVNFQERVWIHRVKQTLSR